MSAPPTRCCAPATKGRCSNAPAPYGQSRYIGCVEIAACNHPKHQAALRSLPDFQRRAGVCGADDCGKAADSGLCPEHRQLYRRHGVNIRALLAQEAPMTEPTPEAPAPEVTPPTLAPDQTREVQVWRGQDWVDCGFAALKAGDLARMREDSASEWGSDTFRTTSDAYLHPTPKGLVWTVDAVPMPPVTLIPEVPYAAVAPTPPAAPQEAADEGATPSGSYLACITPGCGDEDLMDLDQTTGLCGMCTRQKERATAPPATVEEFLRDLESGDSEPSEGDVADAPLFVGGTDSAPVLPGRWGQKHATPPQPMSPDLDGLAALAARGQQPTAPGPTLADVQAQLERERERADRAELDAVCLLMQRLGSYGPDAPAMLMRLLPVESRRALLEIEAADARGELARARANMVSPTTTEKLAEYAAKVAEVEARIAALDAGDVRG